MPTRFLPVALLLLCACRGPGAAAGGDLSGTQLLGAGPDGAPRRVELAEAAERILASDVAFLGELHDNQAGHDFYAALAERVLELAAEHDRPVSLSLEMFERDSQDLLDGYLAGRLTEEQFLAAARPWPDYARHYRPLVEAFRRAGGAVIAANVPRRVAARIGREGFESGRGSVFAAHGVDLREGEYKRRFMETMSAMAGHGMAMSAASLERFYAAQVVKDDTMAESIAEHLAGAPEGTLVLHACGRFHSDYGLGTVERLTARRPDLEVLVFSMSPRADAVADLSGTPPTGDFVLSVPEPKAP
jgi:uncharacterized iron-regulated protein